MDFVQLNRWFAPIKGDKEIDATIGRMWGPKYGGWLQWAQLLKQQRVVLLAEADSGKTEEFRETANLLFAEGKAAFFLTVEALVDGTVEDALEIDRIERLHDWQKGFEVGYFFLDSVDEARLNRKRFDTALLRLSKVVAGNLARSQIYVSCRYSDWRGDSDRAAIERVLPFVAEAEIEGEIDFDKALLDPMFKEKNSHQLVSEEKKQPPSNEVAVVGFVPLQSDQQLKLAQQTGINDSQSFVQAITRQGLDNLAERPGDLLNLASYWAQNGKFGTLSEMLHLTIERKLNERDVHRTDNDTLAANEVWTGAERLAGALTFSKTFSAIAPGLEQDLEMVGGAVDPRKVLPDWATEKQNALLRRGVFSPSTYGRVRFHHRSTQEYLTARWLEGILNAGCLFSKVYELIFATTYGVTTVRPSLRATAAWLSSKNADIRNAVLKTDPLILVQHGDPQSLPLSAKKELLKSYAALFGRGSVYDDSIDHRALWLFADKALADTIKQVWNECAEQDFRGDILRLILQGQISECGEILEQVAFDEKANVYHRVVAVEAMVACDLTETLSRVRTYLAQVADKADLKLTNRLAKELFPKHLSPPELIDVIKRSRKPEKGSTESFGYDLSELIDRCPQADRDWLLNALAELTLSQPFKESYRRVSKDFGFLTKEFSVIAHGELVKIGASPPSIALTKTLMAIERADRDSDMRELKPSIDELINGNRLVKEHLFWADVDEALENETSAKHISEEWQIYFPQRFWRLDVEDLAWLEARLSPETPERQRRIALSACEGVLRRAGRFPAEAERLLGLVADSDLLCEAVKDYCKPRLVSEEEKKYQQQHRKYQKKEEIRTKKDKDSWRRYRDKLLGTEIDLVQPNVRDQFLSNLTKWLHHKTKQDYPAAMKQWPLLSSAFSRRIAETYRDELIKFWRHTQPERPARKNGNTVTTKWATIWAYGAVGIEADVDNGWAEKLTVGEAERAAQHGIQSEQGCPEWLDSLAKAHFEVVQPMVKLEIEREWMSDAAHSTFLYWLQDTSRPVDPKILDMFLDVLLCARAGSDEKLRTGLRVLVRAEMTPAKRERLWEYAEEGFRNAESSDDSATRLIYLAYLFFLDADRAFELLKSWMESLPQGDNEKTAVTVFADLFDRRHLGLVGDSLSSASAKTLKSLCELAYEKVNPSDDEMHPSGSYTPNKRDHAESGRSAILSALIGKGGQESYEALLELSAAPNFTDRARRFKQLARSVAEKDSELPKWSEAQFVQFEKEHVAPIAGATDLHKVVCATLDEVAYDLRNGDATSMALLKKLNTKKAEEIPLRDWLMEQLKLRSKNRYHAFKESQVADVNRTDITVAATSGPFELVIEVKQADSWSPNQLVHALEIQLGEDYLKIGSRRHGVLFMSNHGRKGWNAPDSAANLSFANLVDFLSQKAKLKISNASGPIQLAIKFIDVAD